MLMLTKRSCARCSLSSSVRRDATRREPPRTDSDDRLPAPPPSTPRYRKAICELRETCRAYTKGDAATLLGLPAWRSAASDRCLCV